VRFKNGRSGGGRYSMYRLSIPEVENEENGRGRDGRGNMEGERRSMEGMEGE
jgi:hypothetical protein